MSKADTITDTPTHTYQVSYTEVSGMAPLRKDVAAAYFQSDDGFTVFKDANGKAVYAIKNDILCAIERIASADSGRNA